MNRRNMLLAGAALVATSARAQVSSPVFRPSAALDFPFDQISNLYGLYGACRLIGSYRGPLYQVRNDATGALTDIYPKNSNYYGYPLSSDLLALAAGAMLTVSTIYDQSGNGRNFTTQTTVANQPRLDLSGVHPTFELNYYPMVLSGTGALAAFNQNSTGNSVVLLRKLDGKATPSSDNDIFTSATGTGSTRMSLYVQGTTGNTAAAARRLDTDAFTAVGATPADRTVWLTQIGRWDWANGVVKHQIGTVAETGALPSSGATSNTASTNVSLSTSAGGGAYARVAALALVSRVLTDLETNNLVSALAPFAGDLDYSTSQFLRWSPLVSMTGPYTLAPGAVTTTLVTPSGATPTAADLASHRYHHEANMIYALGRLWIAYASDLMNEQDAGMLPLFMTSADGGATWSSPAVAVPSPAIMTTTPNSRISFPNSFQMLNGNLYFLASIDASDSSAGYAMVACLCASDGTMGTPFLITTTTYTPIDSTPSYTYNSTLGPQLLTLARLTGRWGGAKPPGISDYSSWLGVGGSGTAQIYLEPTTVAIDNTGVNYQRLWRKIGTPNSEYCWWSQISRDGGATWSQISPTRIPNSPAAGFAMRLPDGRIALAGNPFDGTVLRDPLMLALFDGTTGQMQSVYAVRQGLSGVQTYAGTGKGGGAQYPGMCFDGTNIWVGHVVAKELVCVTKIPLAGL